MSTFQRIAYPLVAALSLAAAGAAFAEDITPDNTASVASLKTREQVRAELDQARADGSMKVWSTSYNHMAAAKSVKTRAEVKAERDSHFAATWYGEDSGSFALSKQPHATQAGAVYAAK